MEQKKFKPFEKVIVKRKDRNEGEWTCCEFSHIKAGYIVTVGGTKYSLEWYDILSFAGNETLVGTSDVPEEVAKLKEEEVTLEPMELIFVFDKLEHKGKLNNLVLGRFSCINGDKINTYDTSLHWTYCIPFSKFNPNDIEETKKHILCVKNGKLVKAIEETLKPTTMNEETNTYLERMRELTKSKEHDVAHGRADDILCELVEKYVTNGVEIVKEYNEVEKWYS